MELKKGDKVMFSRDFLRNTGQFTGWAPFAEGVIESLEPLGGNVLARINWNFGETTTSCLTVNLIRKDRKHLERV